MGRLKVPSAKKRAKSNVPITRIGRKQYLKRRFAARRAVDRAGSDNKHTKEYFRRRSSAAQNFSALGLAADPSLAPAKAEAHRAKVPAKYRRELKEVNELSEEYQAQRRAQALPRPVSEREGSTLANLIEKYGSDYKRMSLDRRLNPFQLNVRQLQRQCVNYLKWERMLYPEEYAKGEKHFSVESFADPRKRSTLSSVLPATDTDASAVADAEGNTSTAGADTAAGNEKTKATAAAPATTKENSSTITTNPSANKKAAKKAPAARPAAKAKNTAAGNKKIGKK